MHDTFSQSKHYYTVTLEFGQEIIDEVADPFAVERIHKEDTERAELSTGIHPIVRHFSQANLLNTHHIIENIDSAWVEDVHKQPLLYYFSQMLAKSG